MTALAAASDKVKKYPLGDFRSHPVAASQLIYYGALVVLDAAAATAKEATGTASGHLKVIGVARGELLKGTSSNVQADDADNSSGSAGDISVLVEIGTFTFVNDGTSALAAADIGIDCYVVDDATVSKDSNKGNRPVAGVFRGLSSDSRAIVDVGMDGKRFSGRVLSILSNADLSALQNTAVYIANDGGAGEVASATSAAVAARGVLLNAPTAGLPALVCVSGPAPCLLSGSVTAGDAVVPASGGAVVTVAVSALSQTQDSLTGGGAAALGTANDAMEDCNDAVTGVDGSGSNAASKADVDTRLVAIGNNFQELYEQLALIRTDVGNIITRVNNMRPIGIALESGTNAQTKMIDVGAV